MKNMDQITKFLKSLEGLAVKEDAHLASVTRAAFKIANSTTGNYLERRKVLIKAVMMVIMMAMAF